MNWKILAIVLIVLFTLETIFLVWIFWIGVKEENRMNECLYNVCSENYDAWYEDSVCTCYDLDIIGEYVVSKTKLMD